MRGNRLLLITGLDSRVNESDLCKKLDLINVYYIKILRNHQKESHGIACICIEDNNSSKKSFKKTSPSMRC